MQFPRFAMLLVALNCTAGAAPGFFRSPALHGDQVVFTAEGDLWVVAVAGGAARRLTSHPGLEMDAGFSPDGSQVAFSAQYEGPREVYVMPVAGGLPKRLTWHGEGARPVGWTRDGKVRCASRAHSGLPDEQLSEIDPATGRETVIPLAQASEGVTDDTGERLFFTRLAFQGSATRRYRGGTAQNLWRFDAGGAEAVPLTADFTGTSKGPMWWKGRVYFLSDRSGSMNLWSMLADGSDLKPLTFHQDFEVRTADLQAGRAVYQHAGTLRLLDLESGADREIPITLPSDFDQMRGRWVTRPFDYLTRFSLSADGKRLALTARGLVFVMPTGPGGRRVEIPRKPGVRYREAAFLGDSGALVAQTDETGEIEMTRLPADGMSPPELLTEDGTVFRFAPLPSPDGARIAWQDKNLDLWVRDIANRQSVKVATSGSGNFRDLAWSPDGKWLAFVQAAENTFPRIRLYQTGTGALVDATGDRVMSVSPAWSADGKWLYFLSDRELRTAVTSPWGDRQPEPFFTESTRIYALALRKGLKFPFEPPPDLSDTPSKDEAAAKGKPDEGSKAAEVAIDLDGLAQRLYEVPGISGNLSDLTATAGHLFYRHRDGSLKGESWLMRLDIGDEGAKPKVFGTGLRGWDFAANGKSVVLRKDDAFYVVPTAGEAPAKLEKAVPLDGWSFPIDPREEWRQIYGEAWRMVRDFFYDPAMHGVDWTAVRRKYEPWVERVADRSDLEEILQEMSAELSALHMYVRFGDQRAGTANIQPSSLGARLSRDPSGEGWRVDHIHVADPDYPGEQGPLSRPGVDVREGDVIVSIDGRPLREVANPQELLERKAGRNVLLQVRGGAGAPVRPVYVKPLTPDQARDLRYSEWEHTRRLETETLGEGRIGYVHLRNMGEGSILEWARNYYPVFNRQGLILDLRHNMGGNTDSWILSRLLRKAWFMWSPRAGETYWNMQFAFRGHLTVLCDQWTSSDGEAFTEGFRRLGLGKVIGTRTWGGQIWLSTRRWLVDNGMCTAAEFGVYGPEGEWLIEGKGVEPDEVVDNLPHATFNGGDAQLQRAVNHLKELIEKDPRPVPPVPPRPDKSGN